MRTSGLRTALGLSTAAAALLFLGTASGQGTAPAAPAAGPAPAAEDTAPAAEASEEVVVTGSRIQTRPLNAPQPVQVIGAEELALKGTVDVVDQLDLLPALLGSLSTAQASAFAGAQATLSLRSLGEARTLVLIDGKRHVAGVPGSAAVDINSIPSALIERVEVLTGGASAVYGSDAVTGVVNFVMKKNFEGYAGDFQAGVSSQGDGAEVSTSHIFGANFGADDRGNLTIAVQGSESDPVFYGSRAFSRNNGIANDYTNPARFFQAGDPLPPGARIGNTILAGTNPRFAGTSQALIDRARNAASRVYRTDPRFSISSTPGTIGLSPVGFGRYAGGAGDFASAALNNACDQTLSGNYVQNNFAVGCWIIDPQTGQFRVFRDGLVAGTSNQFGGDGAAEVFDRNDLVPEQQSLSVQADLRYKFSDLFQAYASLKAVHTDTRTYNPYNSYDDNIVIPLDNPFIPAAVRALITAEQAAGGAIANVTIARDHTDVFDPLAVNVNKTYRFVAGFTGDFWDSWSYDVSVNYGQTKGRTTSTFRLEDRFFAALDAVQGPNGPVCRTTLNPAAPVRRSGLYSSPFAPVTINTFTPGANSGCVPLNLFGQGAPSAEARAWQSYKATDRFTIDQLVVNATLVGDSAQWFSLPGGPIGFAIGAEYRKETSEFIADPFKRLGYVFEFATTANVFGEFDVREAFAEINMPILADVPFAKVLTVNLAGRISDYSTIGQTTTWKADAIWAPIEDVRFRGGYSVAVRAPNIGELFSPLQSAVFRPIDPCDANNINLGPSPANRLANCRADGIPVGWVDPLTARFSGQTGGNANLQEETAKTYTYGVVLRPRFVEGLTITADYWNIEIENAISAVSSQNIVNACYDAPSIAGNPFCALFRRNRTAGSPTFLGFNYLLQTQVNFAKLQASGVDFDVSYQFELSKLGLGENTGRMNLNVAGTWLEDRRNFEVVTDPSASNPEKGELNLPEWALNTTIQWTNDTWTVSLFSTWLDTQYLSGIEVENLATFGPPVETGGTWLHDVSVRWRYSEQIEFTAGIQNLTDEEPYFVSVATPVSGMGRYFFVRAGASF